jgi:hypothetical protein
VGFKPALSTARPAARQVQSAAPPAVGVDAVEFLARLTALLVAGLAAGALLVALFYPQSVGTTLVVVGLAVGRTETPY